MRFHASLLSFGLSAGAAALLGAALSACSPEQTKEILDCLVDSAEVSGRINLASGAQVGATVVIQYSTDDFTTPKVAATVSGSRLSVPFSFKSPCPLTGGTNVKFRAFQDLDGNGSWSAGEAAGRDDGTSNGHSTYRSHLKANDGSSGGFEVEGVSIYLDSTGAQ